jgi:uncharacterized protein
LRHHDRHRLTAPADQEPVKKWLKANVSKEIFDKVSTSLASLKTGSAWICSGEAQVAELVQFPKISTFDNSATLTGNEASQEVKTAPVDQDKLRAIIGTAVKEAEADDPKALRAEITRLNADLAKKPAAPAADPAAIEAANRHGFDRGFRKGFEDAVAQARQSLDVHRNLIGESIKNSCASITHTLSVLTLDLQVPNDIPSGSPTGRTVPTPTRAPVEPPAARLPSPAARGDGNLSGPEQRIINSLVTWASWGQHQPSNSQVAWLAGYSPSSSSYANPRGALKSKGLLEYPAPDVLQITPDGSAAGVPIALTGSLLDLVMSKLSGPEARILRGIAAQYPRSITNEAAADAAEYSPTSSSYANPRGRLAVRRIDAAMTTINENKPVPLLITLTVREIRRDSAESYTVSDDNSLTEHDGGQR